MESRHQPVLLDEILELLAVKSGGRYVDCTLDGAGHAAAILDASEPDGRLIGMDMDVNMLEFAKSRLGQYGERVALSRSNFSELTQVLADHGQPKVDGILADLGLSSNQLDSRERGFSFQRLGPIDMRMDPSLEQTAMDLIKSLDWRELAAVIGKYGEERFAGKIARAIKAREDELETTGDLAELVFRVIPRRNHPKNIHPATRTFQGLRIVVNHELDSLETMLPQALAALKPGGRLAVISYHSLEDRIVRRTFKDWEKSCVCPPKLPVCACDKKKEAVIVTRKPVTAQAKELAVNPRSRSAKLRIAERTEK